MHSVLIVIHMFVAMGLVALILLQRSEGGALGMGGGPGGLMSGRAAGSVLTRATSGLALVFFITSIALTIFANANAGGSAVLDRAGDFAPAGAPAGAPADLLGAGGLGDDLLGGSDATAETPGDPGEIQDETPADAPPAPETGAADEPEGQ
jgi:preprotein translocase subunit SecG